MQDIFFAILQSLYFKQIAKFAVQNCAMKRNKN